MAVLEWAWCGRGREHQLDLAAQGKRLRPCYDCKNSTSETKAMAAKTETITCRFIGDFKVGDNLVSNSDALCKL